MHNVISRILEENYNIKGSQLFQQPGGWSAYAYKICTKNQDYFLKIYNKRRCTTQDWVNGIENYMPILIWLSNHSRLHDQIPRPVVTVDGSYKCEDKNYIFLLFQYVTGETIGFDKELSLSEQQDLAEILSELHRYGEDIPVPTKKIKEDFDVSFCDRLVSMIDDKKVNHHKELSEIFLSDKNVILENVAIVKRLAKELQTSDLNYVLCHTDVHGGNLIQADRLVLIDWDGLKLAPAEADLFVFSEGFFFEYAWEKFLSVYQRVHPKFEINETALLFYRLCRRLKDIHEFAESILYDELSFKDQETFLDYLKKECLLLK